MQNYREGHRTILDEPYVQVMFGGKGPQNAPHIQSFRSLYLLNLVSIRSCTSQFKRLSSGFEENVRWIPVCTVDIQIFI